MEVDKLIRALYESAYAGCIDCEYEDNCCEKGCSLKFAAAECLERLQAIAMDPDSVSRAEKQAVFRLGQKDMQQSVLLLLQDLAQNVKGLSHGALVDAANLIEDMNVFESNTGGGANG